MDTTNNLPSSESFGLGDLPTLHQLETCFREIASAVEKRTPYDIEEVIRTPLRSKKGDPDRLRLGALSYLLQEREFEFLKLKRDETLAAGFLLSSKEHDSLKIFKESRDMSIDEHKERIQKKVTDQYGFPTYFRLKNPKPIYYSSFRFIA